MFPTFQDLGDRTSRGDELGHDDEHSNEREEHDAVCDHRRGSDVEENGDVDADVVTAVSEGDPSYGPDSNLLAFDLRLIVVIVVPAAPCLPSCP